MLDVERHGGNHKGVAMEHVARRSGEENIEPAAWRLFDDRELRDRYGRYYGRESTPLHGPVSLFDEE